MKRAIFKLGQEAIVHTCYKGVRYSVKIPKDWVTHDEWKFPIEDDQADSASVTDGTEIEIRTLNDQVAKMWSKEGNFDTFIQNLTTAIQESYSLIIQKGFMIKINGESVKPKPIELLVEKNGDKKGVRPYVFMNTYGTVTAKVAIGFYSPMASDEEIEEMNESKRSRYDAGITVVCNDRIVLYNDKSYLTGWGVSGVPQYHPQFIGIKGIVTFVSNRPQDLPMTTTKRGVDHSSAVYIAVKDKICEGLKMFTNYTNQWKGRNTEEREYSKKTERVDHRDLFSAESKDKYGIDITNTAKGSYYRPVLPKPVNDSPFKSIRYLKAIAEIKMVMKYLYGDVDEGISASDVGRKCFEVILDKAKE